MAWHPQGKALVFSVERKGELRVYFYTSDDGKLSRRVVHNMDKILSMNYAPDGKHLVFSLLCEMEGRTCVYVPIQGNCSYTMTDDLWDDVDPIFTGDGKHILFASNRPSDSLTRHAPEVVPYQRDYDLFVLNVNQIDRHVVPLVRLDRSP
jgi:Tol biopolymer transport system component